MTSILSNREIAAKVIEVIKDESKWCSGVGAKDAKGNATVSSDPEAVKWCALGAAARFIQHGRLISFMHDFQTQFSSSITSVNDGYNGRESVISCLERMT